MSDGDPLDVILMVENAYRYSDIPDSVYPRVGSFAFYTGPIYLVLIALAVGMVYWSPHGTADKAIHAWGILAVTSWWLKALAVVLIPLYPAYQAWQAVGQSKITHHFFSKDGIELVRASGSSVVPWTDISRVIETPKGFLFYQGSRMAAFVPRRCLQGEAEINIIRKFAGKYIANAKLLA